MIRISSACSLLTAAMLLSVISVAQSVQVDKLKDNFKKENVLKLSGDVSANGVFTSGEGVDSRLPFTWYLNSTFNARLFNMVNVPVSFFFTNVGAGLHYPTLPNRLSLHPSYKWITAHVGDIAMAFSPYTLNGHQFTGVGIDAAIPHTKLTISAMYGRLQKATPFDTTNHSIAAAYRRMGYGAKLSYTEQKWRVGYTCFHAKDEINSIGYVPDSFGINPKQNLVMSVEGGVTIFKNLELSAEYATTAITQNLKDTMKSESISAVQIYGPLVIHNNTTRYYKALRGALNYALPKTQTVVGVSYERINPGYQTLGAYYFNEDLESYSLNLAQQLMKNKLALNASIGYQRDDLDNVKGNKSKRFVNSIFINYIASERFMLGGSYSSFQTYMFIRPQFDVIDQAAPLQFYDTTNYSQLSQNATMNTNYVLSKSADHTHSMNINLSFFDAVNKNGEVVTTGGSSQLYNAAALYGLSFIPSAISVSAGVNVSYNTFGANNFTTYGPTASASIRFKKNFSTSLAASYNVSSGTGESKVNVTNIRYAATYSFLKRHNLNLGLMNQIRFIETGNKNYLVTTLGYNYSF